jgi:type II secretory pathway pseudopilin PulG
MFNNKKYHNQSGQTLVETVVAIFIMVMGITSALGLAIYSLNASTSISKQVIAVGLAREGIEVIKNMRDTNWLRDTLDSDCYDYPTATKSASCYAKWLNPTGGTNYNIDPPSDTKTYSIEYDGSNELMWELNPESVQLNSKYALNYDSTASNGLYFPSSSGSASSDFFRKITLQKVSNGGPSPYNADAPAYRYAVLKVTSQVWWKDKNCPNRADNAVPDYQTTDTKCLITLNTYLTNWKNY